MIITAKFASTCPCCVGCTGSSTSVASSLPRKAQRSYTGRQDCRKYGWDGVVGSSSYYSSGQYDEDS
jgi:hypothetical protein